MTTTATTCPLVGEIMARVRAADARLRADPFYSRLLAGEVDRDEYAAWLIQMHKYVRYTVPSLQALVDATAEPGDEAEGALHDYARHEAAEETGHDDLLLNDLAALWGCDAAEALRRVDAAPTAPSVAAWDAIGPVLRGRFPRGIMGAALAMESIASMHSDAMRAALLQSDIPDIERAVSFLEIHNGETEGWHADEDKRNLRHLATPEHRAAASYFSGAVLSLFEGLVSFVREQMAARGATPAAS